MCQIFIVLILSLHCNLCLFYIIFKSLTLNQLIKILQENILNLLFKALRYFSVLVI